MKITNKDISFIIDRIVKGYKPDKIWLFGSFSNEKQNESSDIDLLIIKQTDIRPIKRPAEIHKLFDPYIYDLDVLVYTPNEFNEQKDQINTIAFVVNNEGKIVYERNV